MSSTALRPWARRWKRESSGRDRRTAGLRVNAALRIFAALAASGLLALAGGAHAAPGDRLEVFASETLTHDDNVLRLSDSVDPLTTLGARSKGDTVRATSYGLNLDLPISLQRFQLGAKRTETRHDRFTSLDLNGYDAAATWHWQLGEHSRGRLGHARSRTLAAFGNLLGGVASITPNVLVTRRSFVEAAHDITARWQGRIERERFEQANSADERHANDIVADNTTLTLGYTTPPGNRVGLDLQQSSGRLPNALDVAGTAVDNSYRQRGAAVFVDWSPSVVSRLRARLGHDRRVHEQLPQRDFAGPTYRVGYEWRPSELLTTEVVARQEISATEEIHVGLVRVRGVGLQTQWRPTDKLQLAVQVDRGARDFLGDPAVALGAAAPRTERIVGSELTLGYQPASFLRTAIGWRREQRRSNVSFADYRFNALSLAIHISI